MQTLYHTLLLLHVLAGAAALISGLFAIIYKKGSKNHKKSGKIYFWSMIAVIFTAIPITIIRPNLFLFCIAIFSFYLCYTGLATIYLPKKIIPPFLKYTNWPVNIAAIATGLVMIYISSESLILSTKVGMNIVLMVFGFFLLSLSLSDFFMKINSKKFPKGEHLILHISRMGGSYIATFTAFFVVNVQFEPSFVPWLLPTAIGTPLISIAIARWKKQINKKKQPVREKIIDNADIL